MLRTILVPLDGSQLSEQALPIAGPLAATMGARLLLVRAAWVPHLADLSPEDAEIHSIEVAEDYLAAVKARLEADGLVVDTAIPFAPAGEGILIEIDLHRPDLVVMSTHGRSGISRLRRANMPRIISSDGSCSKSREPVSRARASRVRSSSVGPRPPVISTISARATAVRRAPTLASRSSAIVV